jgi:diaminopimelate epimerase
MIFNYLQRINFNLTLMIIVFNKYQGTGNDFIIIDNRKEVINASSSSLIAKLCDRRFGIGADGLILISESSQYDFEMQYFNSDGLEGSMCGNGGRCASAYAMKEKIAGEKLSFKAIDGVHGAELDNGVIRLQMNNVEKINQIKGNYFINTGSPHCVLFRNDIDSIDVNTEGKSVRWSDDYAPEGTNVNFVEVTGDGIYVRTFERGVEEETLSCGTGVTASAIASVLSGQIDTNPVRVKTKGGNLSVSFNIIDKTVCNIRLSGPATFVYEGMIEI